MSKSKSFELTKFAQAVVLYSSIFILTPVFCSLILLSFPLSKLLERNRDFLHTLASQWAKMIVYSNPWWKFELHGLENLPAKNSSVVYVSNHASQTDILAMFITPAGFRWLAKSSLFRIPFLGWAMSLVGYVPVDRGDRKSLAKCMQESKVHLSKGTSMLFFPEGTRSPDGVLRPFKLGAFKLAWESGVNIVPVSIIGSVNLLPKGRFLPRAAKVVVKFHPAISTEGESPESLANAAFLVIQQDLGQLK